MSAESLRWEIRWRNKTRNLIRIIWHCCCCFLGLTLTSVLHKQMQYTFIEPSTTQLLISRQPNPKLSHCLKSFAMHFEKFAPWSPGQFSRSVRPPTTGVLGPKLPAFIPIPIDSIFEVNFLCSRPAPAVFWTTSPLHFVPNAGAHRPVHTPVHVCNTFAIICKCIVTYLQLHIICCQVYSQVNAI